VVQRVFEDLGQRKGILRIDFKSARSFVFLGEMDGKAGKPEYEIHD
jgi:hypothetical protein